MKLLKTSVFKNTLLSSAIAMSISAFSHAGVTFTELPISTWGGSIAVNDQGTVAFPGDYSLYKWSSVTGLIELGDVAWGRVAQPSISSDGNTIAFSNVNVDQPEVGALQSQATILFKNGDEEIIYRNTLSAGGYNSAGVLSPNGNYLLGANSGDPASYNIHTSQLHVYSEFDDASTNTNFHTLKDVSLSGDQKLFLANVGPAWLVPFFQDGAAEPIIVDLGFVNLGGMTENGQYVLGESNNCSQVATGQVAMCASVWNTSNQEVTGLGYFRPTSINRDGSLVVGNGWSDQPGAKVWDSLNGTRNLSDVLQQHGVNVSGWSEFRNLSVSPDGNYIAGFAKNPAGQTKPFVVNIIPECYGF